MRFFEIYIQKFDFKKMLLKFYISLKNFYKNFYKLFKKILYKKINKKEIKVKIKVLSFFIFDFFTRL